jgi:hypothetical protein
MSRHLLLLLNLLICCSCSSYRDARAVDTLSAVAHEAQPGGPSGIRAVDSVQLAESDSLYIAMPTGLSVGADGRMYISDHSGGQLIEFNPRGGRVRTIAKRGSGPGELESFGETLVTDDQALVAANYRRLRIELFDSSGAFIRGLPTGTRFSQISRDANFVVLSWPDGGAGTSATAIDLTSGRSERIGRLPELLVRFPHLAGPFGSNVTVRHRGRVIQAFEASNHVLITGVDGSVNDSLSIPVLRRRGARLDLLERAGQDTSAGMAALYQSSVPIFAAMLTEEIILLIFSDLERSGSVFTSRYYATLLDLDIGRVCLDLPLAVPRNPLSMFALRGASLFAVVQHVGAEGQPRSYVKRFAVDEEKCPWNFVQRRRG